MSSLAACPAFTIVGGCPEGFDLLRSSPSAVVNKFVYGKSGAVTNAHKSRGRSFASDLISIWCPFEWFASRQSYVPYNKEKLDGRKIIKEVLNAMSDHDHVQDMENTEYRRRVWALLKRMYGDQKW
jgi:hypothetical protein